MLHGALDACDALLARLDGSTLVHRVWRDMAAADAEAADALVAGVKAALGETPLSAAYSCVVLEQVDNWPRRAQKAILPMMERAISGNVSWVLTASQTSHVEPALRSRCIALRVPTAEQGRDVLVEEAYAMLRERSAAAVRSRVIGAMCRGATAREIVCALPAACESLVAQRVAGEDVLVYAIGLCAA